MPPGINKEGAMGGEEESSPGLLATTGVTSLLVPGGYEIMRMPELSEGFDLFSTAGWPAE